MRKYFLLLFAFILVSLPRLSAVTVYTIGDSTMSNRSENSKEQGWATFLEQFFDDNSVVVKNHAAAGRSTKSFYDQGRWTVVKDALQPGDYVFIQFGHNDQKEDQPDLYAASDGSYREFLTMYVNDTRAKGAIPVLMTSVVRRHFDENGVLVNSLGKYPDAVRELAAGLGVAMIDMEKKSRGLVEGLGDEGSRPLYMVSAGKPTDNTHFTRQGAIAIAELAAKGIAESGLPLSEYLRNNDRPAQAEKMNNSSQLLSQAGLSGIDIDGEPLLVFDGAESHVFDPARYSYTYYLPYTYNKVPEIVARAANLGMKVSVSGTGVLSGVGARKEAVITVTSVDGKNTATYSVNFEVLPKLDLFLCIGQSNMAGRGTMDAASGDMAPARNVYLLSAGSQMEAASNPYNKHSNIRKNIGWQKMSPSYSFSKKITEKTGKPAGMVVNALGGSNIRSWQKGQKLYDSTMVRALEARKWGEYKAILWHQGESNSTSAAIAAYPDQLRSMVNSLRSDLGNDNLFFVAGELGYWYSEDYLNFNAMLREISAYIDNAAYVSAGGIDGLPYMFKTSDPHFDRAGCIELGERYAETVWKNVYENTASANKSAKP